jgi:hypothetical protein
MAIPAAPPKDITFARLVQFLLECVRGKFYGTVHIQFRGGQIAMVKREETWIEEATLPVADPQAVELLKTGRVQFPAA